MMIDTPKELAPLAVDAELVRLARGRGALDLELGEVLLSLFAGDGLVRLGYSCQVDYARERLGLPPRSMFRLTQLARDLGELPVLRKAVLAGVISPRKALEAAAREKGRELPAEFEIETFRLSMTPSQQDRLDAAIEMARQVLGPAAPRWQCLEAIAQEWLGSFGEWTPEIEAALFARAAPAPVCSGPAPASGEDPWILDERARMLVERRLRFDEPFGKLAELVQRTGIHRLFGFRTFGDYCRRRLRMAPRTVRERIWLERRMRALPPLREALLSGKLTFTKTLLVARDANLEDVEARIEAAAETTWQQTERESTAEEERRDRAAGVRRLWGPAEVMEPVALAISALRRRAEASGEPIDEGEALALMGDHFAKVWTAHWKRPRLSRCRRAVLLRTGGLCAVPGCSRAAAHEHHIRFRSQGGGDEIENCCYLCVVHHLRALHRGFLLVTGRAGERLTWRLGVSGRRALETWETRGGDDVRRVRMSERAQDDDVRRVG